ncbi:17498_t:CDS:2, partial [Racocetra persica]
MNTNCISIEEFFAILKAVKDQNIENFEQLLDQQKKLKKHEDSIKYRDHLSKEQFYCKGWLILTIDTNKDQVTVELTHDYHTRYIDVRITDKIKEYIKNNIQQTPRILWK